MTFSGAGSIGVGTTSPQEALHVYSSGTQQLRIERNGAGGQASFELKNGNGNIANVTLGGDDRFNISTPSTSAAFNILNNGNVGIGTTTPGGQLEIRGNTRRGTNPSIGSGGSLVLSTAASTAYGDVDGEIIFRKHSPGYDSWKIYSQNMNAGNGLSSLNFDSYNSISSFINVMSLNGVTGNVGIGTTSPSQSLHLYKLSATDPVNAYPLRIESRVTPANPNVGAVGLEFFWQTRSAGAIEAYRENSGGNYATSMIFKTNNAGQASGLTSDLTERMRVNSDGNVGIGTATPSTKLQVIGGTNMDFKVQADSLSIRHGLNTRTPYIEWLRGDSTRAMYMGWGDGSTYVQQTLENGFNLAITGGNVGIGTTTPAAKLEISGGALLMPNNAALRFRDDGGTARDIIVTGADGAVHHRGFHGTDMMVGVNGATYLYPSGGGGSVIVQSNMTVNGTLSKSAGSFNIPHPDPAKEKWRLRHAFVESPTRGDNIYRWTVATVNRNAEVILPDYFKHLNENVQVWVSPVKHFGRAYGEINTAQTILKITSESDGIYNVLLIGTRKDKIAKDFWDKDGVEYIQK